MSPIALNVGTLVGYIEFDATGAVRGVKMADDALRTGGQQWSRTAGKAGDDSAKSFSERMSSTLKSSAAKWGGILAGAFAGRQVITYFQDAITEAGNLEQSIGGVEAVFGDYAAGVIRDSERAANAVGLSRNEYNELITVTGALLKNKGIEDFAGESERLVEIGADLSATYGGDAKTAIEALSAAMRGESDPIERYGITLNETAVQAKMAEMGLEGLEGKAEEQAKTMARLEIITEQSADAHGQFAREADTAQGKAQRLNADLANQRAEIGEKLLPVYNEFLELVRDVGMPALDGLADVVGVGAEAFLDMVDAGRGALDWFRDLPGPVQGVVTGVGAFVALRPGLRRMNDVLGPKFGQGMKNIGGWADGARLQTMYFRDEVRKAETPLRKMGTVGGAAFGGIKSAGRGLFNLLGGPWMLVIATAAATIGNWIGKNQEAKRRVDQHTDAILENAGALGEVNEELVRTELQSSGAYDEAEKLGINLGLVTEAALGNKDAQAELTEQTQVYRDELSKVTAGAAVNKDGVMMLTQEQQFAKTAAEENALAASRLQDAISGQSGEVGEAIDKARQMTEAQEEWVPAAEDAATASDDQADAIGRVNEAVATIVDDAIVYTDELIANKEAAEEAAEAHDAFVDEINDLGSAFGNNRESAANYGEVLRGIRDHLKSDEFKTGLDPLTESGAANDAMLRELVEANQQYIISQAEMGASEQGLRVQMQEAREEFIKQAEAMGASREEAESLADAYGLVPDNVSTMVELTGVDLAKTDVNSVRTYAEEEDAILGLDGDPTKVNDELGSALFRIRESEEDVQINGDDTYGQRVLRDLLESVRKSERSVKMNGDDRFGQAVLRSLLGDINTSEGTVDVDADTSDADRQMGAFFGRHNGKRLSVGITGNVAMATGGVLPGYSPGVDNLHFSGPAGNLHLSGGEAIMRPEWTRAMGVGWVNQMNAAARSGGVSGVRQAMGRMTMAHRDGGIFRRMPATLDVSAEESIASSINSVMRSVAEKIAKEAFTGGGPGPSGGGMGWSRQRAIAQALVPGVSMSSGPRSGRFTASGFVSYHNRNRAVDMVGSQAQMMRLYQLLLGRYGNASPEIYFGPGGLAARYGRKHFLTGVTAATHPRNHVHWAHKLGGTIPDKGSILDAIHNAASADTGRTTLNPGWNLRYNGLGRDEHLAEKWGAASQVAYQPAGGAVSGVAPRMHPDDLRALLDAQQVVQHFTVNNPVSEPATVSAQKQGALRATDARF